MPNIYLLFSPMPGSNLKPWVASVLGEKPHFNSDLIQEYFSVKCLIFVEAILFIEFFFTKEVIITFSVFKEGKEKMFNLTKCQRNANLDNTILYS